ncbi:MAG: ribonuclease HII [Alphaproteobacteria bacterium]
MPDFSIETAARSAGVAGAIVGVDEVGRGPWAGPVFACAALMFERDVPDDLVAALADSKTLPRKTREALAPRIAAAGIVALGEASVEEIDRFNILGASLLAMARATDALAAMLGAPPALALVDGNRAPKLCCPAETVVKGDGLSVSIAAASIFAKVARDRHMAGLATLHPGYGWERNAGYGVEEHKQGLQRLGPTIHHRRTFAPVAKLLTQGDS